MTLLEELRHVAAEQNQDAELPDSLSESCSVKDISETLKLITKP